MNEKIEAILADLEIEEGQRTELRAILADDSAVEILKDPETTRREKIVLLTKRTRGDWDKRVVMQAVIDGVMIGLMLI